MLKENPIFPNTQAQEQKVAGIYENINSDFLNLLKNDLLKPKPLLVCSGGTSSRCAAEGHWTLDLRENYQKVEFNKPTQEITIEAGVNMQQLLEKALTFNRSFPIGLSGKTLIHIFPVRLIVLLIVTRTASICLLVIQHGCKAFNPYSPKDTISPPLVCPRIRPRDCFLHFAFFGINMAFISYSHIPKQLICQRIFSNNFTVTYPNFNSHGTRDRIGY